MPSFMLVRQAVSKGLKHTDRIALYAGCLKSKYILSNLIFFSGTDHRALVFSENSE